MNNINMSTIMQRWANTDKTLKELKLRYADYGLFLRNVATKFDITIPEAYELTAYLFNPTYVRIKGDEIDY